MQKQNIIKEVIINHNLDIIEIENYTNEIAKIIKINPELKRNGKLIVITAMNPIPSGEGKTTNAIGLVDILNFHGLKTIGVLREPSLGPVFGIKGTGAGSNKAMLEPFDRINLHFTGDLHAIASANNMICAIIENEIYQNSDLNIDENKILWKRCLDINDRSLREIQVMINSKIKYQTSFNITAASDLMALFCLAHSKDDFKNKLNNTIVAYSKDDKPIYISDLKIIDALMAILNDALCPNIVRTLESNPVIVHGGPFANIAHGCSSVIATDIALKLSDVVVTECGFGSDLGLEKFMNIMCQSSNISPSLIGLTISLKSIINHASKDINNKLEIIDSGFKNVLHHIQHIKRYGIGFFIIINKSIDDDEEQLNYLENKISKLNLNYYVSNVWEEGSQNSSKAFNVVKDLLDNDEDNNFLPLYNEEDAIMEKINKISEFAYGANGILLSKKAEELLNKYGDQYKYVCIAKNPYSLTCNPKILNTIDFYNTVIEDVEFNNAASLIIPITSITYRMPGLPKNPNAKNFKLK